ncbi:MAG: tRNA-dihydrouridine synthase family protein [Spirochaetaceae bacterium]|jgi:tRNA-dihydrouridine synthase|nr:tRNA-dihydrouridine synthase family protein [Spirochaetaceae bacterium]
MDTRERYMLAPMAELSHRALRELIESFFNRGGSLPPGSAFFLRSGAKKNAPAAPLCGDTPQRPEYFSEMISAAGLLSGGPFEKWYLDGGPCPERLVYQLLGADPDKLAAAASLLDSRDCLGIDINMGCAAPAITRTGAGVKLMEDIDKAGRIVAAVRKKTKRRLSAKLRLGPRSSPAGESPKTPEPKTPGFFGSGPAGLPGFEYLLAFCRRLEREGAELIVLHPRFSDEKFKRRARWDYVEALRNGLSIPVAGNGDIASAGELVRRGEAGGPVMIGRLAVQEPWVFARVPAGSGGSPGSPCGSGKITPKPVPSRFTEASFMEISFLEETALDFLSLLSRYQPPEFHLSRARRFFRYYCDNFTWAEHIRNKINREETLSGIGRVISGYCRENP